jgi:signal peptidase I
VGDRYSGTIAVDDVVGKAALIVWPIDRFGTLASPDIQHREQAAGPPAPSGGAALAAPYALGLSGAVPLTAARRRRRSRRR